VFCDTEKKCLWSDFFIHDTLKLIFHIWWTVTQSYQVQCILVKTDINFYHNNIIIINSNDHLVTSRNTCSIDVDSIHTCSIYLLRALTPVAYLLRALTAECWRPACCNRSPYVFHTSKSSACRSDQNTHSTHTHPFNGSFLLVNISGTTRKCLQAGCSSWRPTKSVKVLKVQLTLLTGGEPVPER